MSRYPVFFYRFLFYLLLSMLPPPPPTGALTRPSNLHILTCIQITLIYVINPKDRQIVISATGLQCPSPRNSRYSTMVKFLSINAKGLNSAFKRHALFKETQTTRAEVLFVQETHFIHTKHPHLYFQHYPQIFMANSESKRKGVLIAIYECVNFQHDQTIIDPEGRFLILLCKLDTIPFTLVNIYAPNSGQVKFLVSVETHRIGP